MPGLAMSPTPQRTILLLLLAALLVTGILALSFPDRLLEAIHPWLERVASERLEGRVSYERLALRRGTLVIDGLRLERGDGLRGDVPHLEAQWTFAGLLGRRLEELRVESPSFWFTTTEEEREPLPSRPP
ncbi:MAG: hypothetical protein IH614_09065, partial [Desulfuromonadales bacterium]|nr:hypothetical protein [Desulfuromonadales bacterium]